VELRQLEYFTAIARFSNFHRAAAELGVTQPTLSIQLKKLEKELGVVLVDRDQRGVRLTELGRVFAGRVGPVLTHIKAVAAAVSEVSALSGRVVVGSSVLGTLRVPPLVKAFRARHPKVDLVLRQQPYSETMRLLMEGTVDLAIVLMHPTASQVPAGLTVEARSSAAVGVLVRPNHRLAGKAAVSLSDLQGERLVLLSPQSASRVAFDLAAAKAGFRPEVPPYEAMTSDTLCMLIHQGMGVGITTETTARSSPYKLVFHKVSEIDDCSLCILWPGERARAPAAAALLDFLRQWQWDRPDPRRDDPAR
jgi:LysR family transcriptional regulator, hydrogen peroxide-inducible genes activator